MPSFSTQRRIIENADERLRQPQPGGREESACVVCARRFWKDELKLLFLFEDPTGREERSSTVIDAIPGNQQERLCRLLGVERYKRRWPHIDEDELRRSAVEHPYLAGQFLLLHKRRMPADVKEASLVCKECKGPLTASTITLPRLSLANDLWMGVQPPALRNLASATKRLLPMTRACKWWFCSLPTYNVRNVSMASLATQSFCHKHGRQQCCQSCQQRRSTCRTHCCSCW